MSKKAVFIIDADTTGMGDMRHFNVFLIREGVFEFDIVFLASAGKQAIAGLERARAITGRYHMREPRIKTILKPNNPDSKSSAFRELVFTAADPLNDGQEVSAYVISKDENIRAQVEEQKALGVHVSIYGSADEMSKSVLAGIELHAPTDLAASN